MLGDRELSIPVPLFAALMLASPASEVAGTVPTADAPASPSSVVAPPVAPVPAPEEAAAPGKDAPPPSPTSEDGAIVVTGREEAPPGDPIEAVNAASFAAVQAVDDAIVAPAAKIYERGLPKPVRTGIRNMLHNLAEPINFVNYLLQLKPGKAAETLGRFTVNTTVGIGGLIDLAKKKPFNLPYRPNGFANTLGYYGVGPGPYLYLPLIGPTTLRDLGGRLLDLSLVPSAVGAPFNTPTYSLSNGVIKSLDDRVEADAKLREFHAAPDPYTAEREWYLAMRAADIAALRGKPAPAPVPVSPAEASLSPR